MTAAQRDLLIPDNWVASATIEELETEARVLRRSANMALDFADFEVATMLRQASSILSLRIQDIRERQLAGEVLHALALLVSAESDPTSTGEDRAVACYDVVDTLADLDSIL